MSEHGRSIKIDNRIEVSAWFIGSSAKVTIESGNQSIWFDIKMAYAVRDALNNFIREREELLK